jgi:hypothetical protein
MDSPPLFHQERSTSLCQEIAWIRSVRSMRSLSGLYRILCCERLYGRFAIDTLREWGVIGSSGDESSEAGLDAYAALLRRCRDGALRWDRGALKIAQTREHGIYLRRRECTCIARPSGDALCPLECEILYLRPERAAGALMSIETLRRVGGGGCAYRVHRRRVAS